MLLAIGCGVQLIVIYLLNGLISRMSVSEIYEWFAEKYPNYLYTKCKIRYILRYNSETTSPRFIILNRNRAAGVPI